MLNNLVSTFLGGFLYTLMFFVISFVTVLFFRLCAYYFKTNAPKRPEKKEAEPKAEPEPVREKAAPPRPRRKVHTIEIRPDEINRIYVADKKNVG